MLYWTDERPNTGWRLVKMDDGTWRAEELGGPRALTAANVNGLVQQLQPDDEALKRRFTERQVREAATAVSCDPDALASKLRAITV